MKNTSPCWTFLFMLCLAVPALATDFQKDLAQLKKATEIGNIATPELYRYLDPRKGALEFRLNAKNAPWAGNYFPMQDGGIANRWQKGQAASQLYRRDELSNMSAEEISTLSPIEKYDILQGDYEYKATNFELTRRGPLREKPVVQEWEGFCNGVRCAGFLLPEPQFPVKIKNADGVLVEFQPADLKALAGASYFYVEKYAQLGSPSKDTNRAATPPDPAVFDLALRYNLARKRKTFVIDANLTSEIWNETVVGFKRTLGATEPLSGREENVPPQAVSKMNVNLVLETLGEVGMKDSNMPTREKVANAKYLEYIKTAYTLFLDSEGRAVGGVWHKTAGDRGIDFVWFAAGRGTDKAHGKNTHLDFNTIRRLFRESVHPYCHKIFSI